MNFPKNRSTIVIGTVFLFLFMISFSAIIDLQIQANPKISVYFCKVDEVRSLMLAGSAEILTDTHLKKQLWQDRWKIHWPTGPDDPDYTIIRLLPTFARGWHKDSPFEFNLK